MLYAEKFEGFLVRMTETALELAKIYYSPEMTVAAVGRNERINIDEFKSTEDLAYQIRVVEQVGDISSVMGKALMGQAVLQYVGKQLSKQDIGRVLRAMPYLNDDEAFGSLSEGYESIKNEILALDRGKWRPAHPSDEHPEYIKAFMSRKRKADFEFLPPQIQQMYDARIKQHQQMIAEQEQKIIAAKNQYIPVGGLLVGVDMYVPGSGTDSKLRRARLPYDAVLWLIKRLEEQGQSLQMLESMNQQALADMAGMIASPQPGAPAGSAQGPQQIPGQSPTLTNEQIAQMSQNTYGGVS
jgi:hypothetical protein